MRAYGGGGGETGGGVGGGLFGEIIAFIVPLFGSVAQIEIDSLYMVPFLSLFSSEIREFFQNWFHWFDTVIRWAWLLSNQTISCFTNRIPMRQKIPANHKRKDQ